MAANTSESDDNFPGRWNHLSKILERKGPLAHPDFEASEENLTFLHQLKILVIGAGGLGCELLKNLALMGFRNIDVIDMDTIELSNLNRQFLFREKDIGKPKAEIAAEFINKRIPGCKVKPHYNRIQDFDESFYQEFRIVVCGLDSILARRWINGMLIQLLDYNEDGTVNQNTIIPMVDGGTEGFKGNARVIYPGMSACIECTLDLYPPQVNFPLCTLAHTPRLPEHCIEYVKVLLWPQENPFGEKVSVDGDNPDHLKWIFKKAEERANSFKITGVTYRLTQGVIKHIIPAVASTNAVIAAVCATEVFKLATSCCEVLNNYLNFSDTEGIYTHSFEIEKNEKCPCCSCIPQFLSFEEDSKLQDVINFLKEDAAYQYKSPSLTTKIDGKQKTLYMTGIPSIEEQTKQNLKLSLKDLGFQDGQEVVVADITSPSSVIFKVRLATKMT